MACATKGINCPFCGGASQVPCLLPVQWVFSIGCSVEAWESGSGELVGQGTGRMSEEDIQARWVILEVIKSYPVAASTVPNCHYLPGRDLRQIIIRVTTH